MTESQAQPPPPPYYPPPPQPHSHDKYVGAILAVGVIALLIGSGIGYGLGSLSGPLTTSQPQQSFTLASGIVDPGISFLDGWIYFDNQFTGTLSSTVFPDSGELPHGYQVYLQTDRAYQVTIYYRDSSGSVQNCPGRPSPFTPTGSDYTQNFLC